MERSEDIIIKSKLNIIPPPVGSNVSLELIRSFKRNSDRVLMVGSESGREWTGSEIWLEAARMADTILKTYPNLKTGDAVLTMCEHHDRELVLILSILLAGLTVTGTASTGLKDLLDASEPSDIKLIVVSNKLFKTALKLRDNLTDSQGIGIILFEPQEGNEHKVITEGVDNFSFFDDILLDPCNVDYKEIENIANEKIVPNKHCSFYMVTSGSTGRSKVVPWTHEKQLNDIWSIISASQQSANRSDGNPEDMPMFPVTKQSTLSGDLPMDQGVGVVSMLWAFINDCKYVILPPYEAREFWLAVSKYKITSSIASTTFTCKLVNQLKAWIISGEAKSIDISSMKYIACVGSKLAFIDVIAEVKKFYKHLNITQFYGATELGFITMLTVEDSEKNLDSVGYLFPGVKAKVVDIGTGSALGPNQRGEMVVWSNTLFNNYLPHPDESLEKLMAGRFDKDGFYRTGDLVEYDEEERFHIHGRLKDTIYVMEDWKVSPVEIESIINKHPLVESSCVLGIPDPEVAGCELIRAFVVLIGSSSSKYEQMRKINENNDLLDKLDKGDSEFIIEHIYEYEASMTAPPKHLRGGIKILDKFPRVGMLGKVDRNTLRQMY